jgi:ribose-phosphate pyrophosphokinase
LTALEERRFDRGEFKIRPLESVRSRPAYIIQSLHGDAESSASDKLCELLFLAGALRDAGAQRICAVIPYLGFARKDRRTQPRDPVTSRYVAQLIEAIGIDQVMVVEVHNPAAFDNAFRIPAYHLTSARLFAEYFAARGIKEPLAVVSPDLGGAKRAQLLREALQKRLAAPVEFGCLEKRRSAGVVSGHYFAGDVTGRVVILFDDLISSGGTLLRAARGCRDAGAVGVHAVAAHSPLTADAVSALSDPAFDSLTITDTVPLDPQSTRALAGRMTVLPIADFLAAAIACVQGRGSLTELLGV